MSGVTDIVSAVIPCLDEEHAIGAVVAAVLAHGVAEVIVVDAASRDRATAAGTRVVIEPRRGYGRAVQAGLAALREDASIVLFLDGGGSDPGWHPSQRVRPSSSAARAFAASAIPEACLCRRSRPGWSADASADGLWRALQRSLAIGPVTSSRARGSFS
jgi:glycosyltransferase involved in cell wall biosynthesis